MRFLARSFAHYVWLALAATAVAVVSWIITVVPFSPSPIAFGTKFGLAFSIPLNFLVIPLAYHALGHRSNEATILRLIGLVIGFALPYLWVLVWRRYDMEGLIRYWRGEHIADNLVLIPYLAFGAVAGIWRAKFFVRLGNIPSIFDLNAVMRSTQTRDQAPGAPQEFEAD
jgi:hypothetical protein